MATVLNSATPTYVIWNNQVMTDEEYQKLVNGDSLTHINTPNQ